MTTSNVISSPRTRTVFCFGPQVRPTSVAQSREIVFEFGTEVQDLQRAVEHTCSAVVVHECAISNNVLHALSELRKQDPDLEILCCGTDFSVLDRASRTFDGFVFYSEDWTAFGETVALVLDRCCARKNHGQHKCKHTKRSAAS